MQKKHLHTCKGYGTLRYQYRGNSSYEFTTITGDYGEWVNDQIQIGWDGYIITFMFNQIRGSRKNVSSQMEAEVQRVYATCLTRIVRNPKGMSAKGNLPIWIVSPDFPVPKYAKKGLRDVTLNDGRHMQGIALIPPNPRLAVSLDDHFKASQDLYVRPPFPLRRLHAEPITHRPRYVTGYCQKALLRGRATSEEIVVFPRCLAEVSSDRNHAN